MSGVTAINTICSYLSDEVISEIANAMHDWSKGEIVEAIMGEDFNALLDTLNIFSSIKENFSDANSVEYAFVATFIDACSYLICLACPFLSIGMDTINDWIKKTLFNMDTGKIWG